MRIPVISWLCAVAAAVSLAACGAEESTTSVASGNDQQDDTSTVILDIGNDSPDTGPIQFADPGPSYDPVDPGQCDEGQSCDLVDKELANGLCINGACVGCESSLAKRRQALEALYGDEDVPENLERCVALYPKLQAGATSPTCELERDLDAFGDTPCVQWSCLEDDTQGALLKVKYIGLDTILASTCANKPKDLRSCAQYQCSDEGEGECVPVVGTERKAGETCVDPNNACIQGTCDGTGNCSGMALVNGNGERTVNCKVEMCQPKGGDQVSWGFVKNATDGLVCAGSQDLVACYDSFSCSAGECKPGASIPPATGACTKPCQKEVCDGPNGMKCVADADMEGSDCKMGPVCTGTCQQDGTCELKLTDPQCCVEDSDCFDNSDCTTNTCNSTTGTCITKPVVCEDNNPCTFDDCSPSNGCFHENLFIPCDDGDACTVGDTCVPTPPDTSVCTPGEPLDCNDDGTPCLLEACDPKVGCTTGTPVPALCDDGNKCTTDTCNPNGTCSKSSTTCDDQNPCTTDSCDPQTGTCTAAPSTGNVCNDGKECTGGDLCQAGVCEGKAKTCASPGPCKVGVCDPANGQCSVQDAPNGTSCNDGKACTEFEACQSGQCTGVPGSGCNDAPTCYQYICKDNGDCGSVETTGATCNDGDSCTTSDKCVAGSGCRGAAVPCSDNNPCTVDTCDPVGGCKFTPVAGSCEDGKACTTDDACNPQTGVCSGTQRVCDDGNSCTNDSCSEPTGCTFLPKLGGCDDGNKCTEGEICTGLTCGSGVPKSCDDGQPCTTDQCLPSEGCKNSALPNGVGCSDGDACTLGDACNTGTCVGTPKACGPTEPCNTTPTCVAGDCQSTALANGTPCEDGSMCTTADKCTSGSCVGTQKPCTDSGECIESATCSEATGNCVTLAKPANSACNDGSKCTEGDKCQGTTCSPGAVLSCNDGNPCTTDSCDPIDGCRNVANTLTCDDGDKCTQSDLCENKQCVGKNPVICTAGQCQVATTCVPTTGTCPPAPKADGTGCTDGSECTVGDACQTGTCIPGAARVCNDGKACTDDQCVATTVGGCVFTNRIGAACEDGNSCTIGDSCQGGLCVSGAPSASCCIIDADCDAKDSNKCDGTLQCVNSQCVPKPNSAVICNAAGDTACKANACAPATGVCSMVNINEAGSCSDGDECTLQDACEAGVCKSKSAVVCTAKSACALPGVCNPQSGVCTDPPAPDGTSCEDGNLCTKVDTCQAGLCKAGTATACSGKSVCHDPGECNPATGTCSEPQKANGTSCDDGKACTADAICQAGACVQGRPCSSLGSLWTCGGGECFEIGTLKQTSSWLGGLVATATQELEFAGAWLAARLSHSSSDVPKLILGAFADLLR